MNEERNERIFQDLRRGMRITDAAHKYGLSCGTISYIKDRKIEEYRIKNTPVYHYLRKGCDDDNTARRLWLIIDRLINVDMSATNAKYYPHGDKPPVTIRDKGIRILYFIKNASLYEIRGLNGIGPKYQKILTAAKQLIIYAYGKD